MRGIHGITQVFLITAIICCISAQEYLEWKSRSNEINQIQVNNARRFHRYDSKRDIFSGVRQRCENSLDCEEEKAPSKVTYHDAYRIRAEQCIEFNKKKYNGQNIKWKPYYRNHMDECKLFCLADGRKFYARLKDSVRDGTPCGRDYKQVCIKGKCQKRPKGCPTIDGPCLLEQRKQILGVFNSSKLITGYNVVTTLPKGATNITIEELTRSRSYLALKVKDSDEYLLNGHWMISLSKTFQIASSKATYIRNGNTPRGGEMITIKGPLDKSLDIMMIYQNEASVIKYSYFVVKEEYDKLKMSKIKRQNLFFPTSGRISTKQKQNDQVASHTDGVHRESMTFKAGDGNLKGRSVPFLFGQRKVSYPRAGGRSGPFIPSKGRHHFSYPQLEKQKRPVFRGGEQNDEKPKTLYGSSWIQFGGDSSGQSRQSSTSQSQLARRPFLKQQIYRRNQFGQKYRDEGIGYQRTARRPIRPRYGTGTTIKQPIGLQNVHSTKKFYASDEANFGGVKYVWRITLTPCSSSCAGGIQSGIVKCADVQSGENVADDKCDFRTRLQETRRVCNMAPCPATWVPQEWKACSKTCGEGRQVRELMCQRTIDRNGEKVIEMLPVAQCPVQQRPEVIKNCYLKECPRLIRPKWIVEDWGECSVECGHGVKRREVLCKNSRNETVKEFQCGWMSKPSVIKACYLGMCKADWYFRPEWSQCSQSCGGGSRSRRVVCARIEGSELPEKHCQDKAKPVTYQTCNNQKCPRVWVSSEWSKCSVECGQGVQHRLVLCMKSVNGNHEETLDAECSLDDKPAVRKECSRKCDPSWFATTWSKCSVSCGKGAQTRQASCLNDEGKRVGGCKAWERPLLWRACQLKACPGSQPGALTSLNPACRDNPPRSFKRYCHIIKRINYCRIPSYKKRCCRTCSTKGLILGRI